MILSLNDDKVADQALSGGKAAGLHKLIRAGLPVPRGWVLVPDSPSSAESVKATGHDVSRLLYGEALGITLFAVRSSCVGEDGSTHSYAGMFQSYLGVPKDHVPDRVEKVKVLTPRSRAYATRVAAKFVTPRVIIQEMVNPSIAGVAFTVDPVEGGGPLIEITEGLGDRLVEGDCVPASWKWHEQKHDEDNWERIAGPDLRVPEIASVMELVKACRSIVGTEVDVELAWDDVRWWVLQARPVTAT